MKLVKYCLNYAAQKAGGTRMLSRIIEFKECADNVMAVAV